MAHPNTSCDYLAVRHFQDVFKMCSRTARLALLYPIVLRLERYKPLLDVMLRLPYSWIL